MHMKKLSVFFLVSAVLLSDVMCAVVAYNYGALRVGGQIGLYSAPASVAFIYVIPYGIGIIVSIVLAVVFRKNAAKQKR